MTESRYSETRKVLVRVQFYNNATQTTTPPISKQVEAPFYRKLRREHPQYRETINQAIRDLAVEAGLPHDQRPVMTQIL